MKQDSHNNLNKKKRKEQFGPYNRVDYFE